MMDRYVIRSVSSVALLGQRCWILLLLILIACDREPPMAPPEPQPQGPQQYGTPFAGVPATEDVVMYEINPRVFSPGMNLAGITARLDSIEKLGVNVLWLMPIYPTGNERSVGSPYAIRDYLSVNPDYGTLGDLRELVDKAHDLGMAVILDWVANHTAWDHPWINRAGWYATDGSGTIIHPPGTNWLDVAELNYDNQAMRQEMIEAMKYWVLEANVDGYRCDYASGAPADFWEAALDTLSSIPDRDLVLFAESGEEWLLDAGFDLIFGWSFYSTLHEVYNDGRTASAIYATHFSDYSGLPVGKHYVRWITNHDQSAWDGTPVSIFHNREGAFGAFVLASYLGGVPLLYNGQEVGEAQQLPFFEGNVVQINWAQHPDYLARYRALLNFRAQSTAARRGAVTYFNRPDVSAFVRKQGSEEVLVIVNVRDQVTDFDVPTAYRNTTWQQVLPDDTAITLSGTLVLQPFESLVLSR